MISRFFIDRPIFASVLSIVIVLAGLLAMRALPVAQYPEIVPPQVVVSATYPGASAQTIAETVAAPLEQQINGVEDMIYMQSTSTASGTLSLSVYFQTGTDPDQATINVNNRVQRATAVLPEEVRRQGVTVAKRSTSILQVVDHVVARPALRHDLHLQLRPGERHRRAAAHPRGRRRLAVRRLRLLDADLAPARQGGAVRADSERHRRRHPRAERPVRGRAVRRGADGGRAGLHLLGRRPRAASPIRASSSRSSCARTRTAPPCGSRTSRASSSAR